MLPTPLHIELSSLDEGPDAHPDRGLKSNPCVQQKSCRGNQIFSAYFHRPFFPEHLHVHSDGWLPPPSKSSHLLDQMKKSQEKEARSMMEKRELLKAQSSKHNDLGLMDHLPPPLHTSIFLLRVHYETLPSPATPCSHCSHVGRNITAYTTTQKIQYPPCGQANLWDLGTAKLQMKFQSSLQKKDVSQQELEN